MIINPSIITIFNLSIFEFIFGEQQVIPGELFGQIIVNLNIVIMTILGLIYSYQIVLSIFSTLSKSKKFKDTKEFQHYTFVTSARNEENVIAQLIKTIRSLDYPQDKITIDVIADNSTDRTAEIARSLGVNVIERNSDTEIGKSYALDTYFKQQQNKDQPANFSGYIIIDTDNILDTNYLKEINKVHQETKAEVIAAYRNSTNLGKSIWTFGTGYSFLRECALLHKGREKIGVSSYVSGTSFFLSYTKAQKMKGWPYHRMIEDIEFSADHVIQGNNIHYAHDAIFYDEQPNNFPDSWHQRMRWVKGLFQVSKGYSWKLFKSIFVGKRTVKERFSAYEAFIFVTPFPAYTLYWLIIYGILSLINYAIYGSVAYFIQTYLFTLFDFAFGIYAFTTIMCLIITFSNWKRIKISPVRKIIFPFFAFFFLITYIPMLLVAPFLKITWRPVAHYGSEEPL